MRLDGPVLSSTFPCQGLWYDLRHEWCRVWSQSVMVCSTCTQHQSATHNLRTTCGGIKKEESVGVYMCVCKKKEVRAHEKVHHFRVIRGSCVFPPVTFRRSTSSTPTARFALQLRSLPAYMVIQTIRGSGRHAMHTQKRARVTGKVDKRPMCVLP